MAEQSQRGKHWFHRLTNSMGDQHLISALLRKCSSLTSYQQRSEAIVKELQNHKAQLDFAPTRIKDNEKAREYRNEGNRLFCTESGDVPAVEMYTKSIAYALPGSRELALAYANRSAVSFQYERYEDCLLDIARALDGDYPEELKAKLYGRRVKCLIVLKRSQEQINAALEETRQRLLKMKTGTKEREVIEKIVNDENHGAPPQRNLDRPKTSRNLAIIKTEINDDSCDIRGATGIGLHYSKEHGRHIAATRDIKPGEIIAKTSSYAKMVLTEQCYRACAYCVDEIGTTIPCDHCVHAIYCTSACRDAAWNEYHEFECPILGLLIELGFKDNDLLAIRTTLKSVKEAGSVANLRKIIENIEAQKDGQIEGFTGNVLDCTKYTSVYLAIDYTKKCEPATDYYRCLVSTFTAYYLATHTTIFGDMFEPSLQIFDTCGSLNFLAAVIMKNLGNGRLLCGSTDAAAKQPKLLHMSPFITLLRYSCSPNVFSIGDADKITMVAIHPIKKGEFLYDKLLGLHYTTSSKSHRQDFFKQNYQLTCKCIACKEDWPILSNLPRIENIPGVPRKIKQLIQQTECSLFQRTFEGNLLAQKEDICRLIELYHKFALPCQELAVYEEKLKELLVITLDL